MGRALMILLIFVVVGPLVGLATFSALLTLATTTQRQAVEAFDKSIDPGDPVALGLVVLIYGIVFAHYVGALWAALAGGIVAVRAQLWGPASIFEGVPVGIVTALASIVFFDVNDIEPNALNKIEVQVAAGWALVHIVSAMACIWITRGWQTKGSSTS